MIPNSTNMNKKAIPKVLPIDSSVPVGIIKCVKNTVSALLLSSLSNCIFLPISKSLIPSNRFSPFLSNSYWIKIRNSIQFEIP